jgi:hypothetical protein
MTWTRERSVRCELEYCEGDEMLSDMGEKVSPGEDGPSDGLRSSVMAAAAAGTCCCWRRLSELGGVGSTEGERELGWSLATVAGVLGSVELLELDGDRASRNVDARCC